MAECSNYIKIDGPQAILNVLSAVPFDPCVMFPKPEEQVGLSQSMYMMQEFGCRWLTGDDDRPIILTRRLTYIEGYFNTDKVPPLPFYRLLIGRFPEIRISYEYFHWKRGIVGHGHINSHNAEITLPTAYAFNTFGQLAAIRSTKLWRLNLAAPGQLPPAPWEYEPARANDCLISAPKEQEDDDGDWTMDT